MFNGKNILITGGTGSFGKKYPCLLYKSDAADDTTCVDLGGRRIYKPNTHTHLTLPTKAYV